MINSITIVTICFNNLAELIETCNSVDSQTCLPAQHVIVDGSSSKQIIEWLKTNKQPAYREWIHERDKGISDAFNKGIRRSTGEIIHLLNSGDRYVDENAVAEVMKNFERLPSLMWVHSLYVQNRGGLDVVTGAPFQKELLWKGMRTVAHPTIFVKKQLYDKYGLFNVDLKIAMDYDFLVRIRNEKFLFIPKPLVYFSPGGASNVQFTKGLAEVRKIYSERVGRNYKLFFWQLRQKLLHEVMQTSIGKFWFELKNKNKIATKSSSTGTKTS